MFMKYSLDEDLDLRIFFDNPSGRFNPIHPRHLYIHQDHIRLVPPHLQIPAIDILEGSTACQSRCAIQYSLQSIPNQLVIFKYDYVDFHKRRAEGTSNTNQG